MDLGGQTNTYTLYYYTHTHTHTQSWLYNVHIHAHVILYKLCSVQYFVVAYNLHVHCM